MAVKGFQKNSIILAIEHVFVWCIVYEQGVASMKYKDKQKKKKKGVKVLVENGLLGLYDKKCKFCMQNS